MDKIKIVGGVPLKGSITISGAKNAALPLMSASLLTHEPVVLSHVPDLMDIHTLKAVLGHLGVESKTLAPSTISLTAFDILENEAPYELVRKMRASILVLGPLLARTGLAKVSLPGGCAIGTRPVNFHIKGLELMGAEIDLENGYITAKAPQGLQGADITFPLISVTGTENLMMAATLAKGTTRLFNAAVEPEVIDLAHCLLKMGAKIDGVGTNTLIIEGTDQLHGCHHRILPDRIEMGTYMMAAAITKGQLDLIGASLDLGPNVISTLEQAGLIFTPIEEGIRVQSHTELQPVDVTTEPFPGFATDLQAQLMALTTQAYGTSLITETIFENRFMHVPELSRMGADITLKGNTAVIKGSTPLTGAPVMATDLRASVSLVLAALAAEGETIINRVYHLDRGYEKVEDKLSMCGAKIERIQGEHHGEAIQAA